MDRVREYYAKNPEKEWSRLDTSSGALEFAVNSRFIERHLPPTGRVLDIGGGPGRYALWLAELGYQVVLADVTPELLTIAKHRIESSPVAEKIEGPFEADARDLSRWQDGEFDAALSLGPFYHLVEPGDRDRGAAELHRVLRPGGTAFVAFMPRYAFLRRTAVVPQERHRLLDRSFVQRLLHDGVFINDVPGRFDGGYGANPSEISPFLEGRGFETLELVASEGLGAGIEDVLAELAIEDRQAYEALMEVIVESAPDPRLHGLTTHLLYVGRRL